MIETHAHLYDEQFREDLDAIILRAKEKGIQRAYLPNCDSETILPMMEVSKQYPDFCFPMMGLHPCYVKENYEEELSNAKQWFEKADFAAVGEIGLDYHWDLSFVKQQKAAFNTQIDWALDLNLPIVIHSRSSTQDCIEIVKSKQNGKLKGVFHCFGDDLETAKQVIDLGFVMGIGGVITFKNSGLASVVEALDLEHIVLETDAPYLAPVPFRGKRNESSYLHEIAMKIAEVKKVSLNEVIEKTTENALRIFT